ncbi:MAG: GGDEF domain-containing protein [Gammaproteobacteria bacterium]
MKILVIEKSEVCRFILEQCLTTLGHAFHHVARAEDALHFIQSHEIDFVFIDMDFGRERAAEAIRSIRALQKNEWWPIAALSSETDDDAYADAILAGADAVLPKPLSRKRILMQVIALERIYIARQSLQAHHELIEANRALLKLSMHDEVTGLGNRRYFEETLLKEIRLAKRNHRHLALLMCDISGLEPNSKGESNPLPAIAAAISSIPTRPTDLVCRYSDSVFAVILPNTDGEGTLKIAAKIRDSVEHVLTNSSFASPASPLSFRIGSATHNGLYHTTDEFVRAASEALQTLKSFAAV